MNSLKWFLLAIIVIVIGGVALTKWTDQPTGVPDANAKQATVYKSPTCGCCGNYVSYLKKQGFKVSVVDSDAQMETIKKQYSIPADQKSCHTTVIGNQFAEGHIPIEVINKMLTEQSNIKGIALPAMPSGSPGMPGAKTEAWEISQLGADGNWGEFMKY